MPWKQLSDVVFWYQTRTTDFETANCKRRGRARAWKIHIREEWLEFVERF